MKTVGIIVEYNPFHNGHMYHLQMAKQTTGADAVVAVMSGNFLQRGEPALVSKWARAEMALAAGVDVVIELPLPFAIANAEIFAHGAVSILDRLGVVDSICFGSESGDLESLQLLAKELATEPAEFTASLKEGLASGLAYPDAYAKAANRYLQARGSRQLAIDQPNNILGLNYLLAIERLGSSLQAVTIKRQKADYHQQTITDKRIASATALRILLFSQNGASQDLTPYVPHSTWDILQREMAKGCGPMNWERFYHPLFHRLLQLTPQQLAEYHEVAEGIEYRLLRFVKSAESVHDLITKVKTRRFTWNRLQRMLLSVLLDLRHEEINALQLKQGASYARILGFSDKGQALLKQAKRMGRIPLFSNVKDGLHPMLDLDIRASRLYQLALPVLQPDTINIEYRQKPLTGVSVAAPSDS